jgi:hypothetical protein
MLGRTAGDGASLPLMSSREFEVASVAQRVPSVRGHEKVGASKPVQVGPTQAGTLKLGYLALPAEVAAAIFQVVSQRYLKTSIVLTSNRGVGSWGEILGDTTVAAAMLDRLLHRSVVLNLDGDSYRLRAHHAANDTLRRTTTGTRQPLT